MRNALFRYFGSGNHFSLSNGTHFARNVSFLCRNAVRRAFRLFAVFTLRTRFNALEERNIHQYSAQCKHKRERGRKRYSVREFLAEPYLIQTAVILAHIKRFVEEIDGVCNTDSVVHFEAVIYLFAVYYSVSSV